MNQDSINRDSIKRQMIDLELGIELSHVYETNNQTILFSRTKSWASSSLTFLQIISYDSFQYLKIMLRFIESRVEVPLYAWLNPGFITSYITYFPVIQYSNGSTILYGEASKYSRHSMITMTARVPACSPIMYKCVKGKYTRKNLFHNLKYSLCMLNHKPP